MAEEITNNKPLWDVNKRKFASKGKKPSTNVVIVGDDINFFYAVLIAFKWILVINIAAFPFFIFWYILFLENVL